MVGGGLSLPKMNAFLFILPPVSPGPNLKIFPFIWTVNNSLWFPGIYEHVDLLMIKGVEVVFFLKEGENRAHSVLTCWTLL